ncbi:hypothetical protein GCM10022222_59470 [Amycolatopsis ultiminotia]|uniref:Uncharacterized protein n=1 Tax=Amycolatopsis ultiminotia TaxID=543629 RepID=A0ABP6XKB7_9PSEU
MSGTDAVRSRLTGACEPWEIPIGRDLAERLDPGRRSRPVPGAAAEDIADLVGPGELLVVPSASRPAPDGPVCVPDQVLGLGSRGVAWWVDGLPYPRIVGMIPYAELVATEHLVAGKHGCLVLTGTRATLVLRYRSWAWPMVRGVLTRLRALGVGSSGSAGAGAESVRWADLPSSPLVGLGHGGPPRWCAADAEPARGRPWRRSRPAAMVALTRHELVVVRHVLGQAPLAHGVDLLAVPRNRITGLTAHADRLQVRTVISEHEVELSPVLAEQARTKLGPLLHTGTREPATRQHRTQPPPRTASPW